MRGGEGEVSEGQGIGKGRGGEGRGVKIMKMMGWGGCALGCYDVIG